MLILAGIGLATGAVSLWLHLRNSALPRQHTSAQPNKPKLETEGDAILSALWADFLKDGNPPIVAYSNSVFLTTETADLLRLKNEDMNNLGASAQSNVARRLAMNPRLLEAAGPVFFEDGYTGTGEVMAAFYLTRMFAHFQSTIQVERSRLVSIGDLTRRDVIFLGSTREDALLAGLPLTEYFKFAWSQGPVTLWSGRILNLHPGAGEQPFYMIDRDPKTGVLPADYALVSFLPGVSPNRRIVILGGLTTRGTQAAADFATSPSGVSEMLAHLGGKEPNSTTKPPAFFQAALRVEIMKDEVLRIHCVAAHEIYPASPERVRRCHERLGEGLLTRLIRRAGEQRCRP